MRMPCAIGFVAQFGNAFELLFVDQFGDALDQAGFVDLERNFSDDDRVALLRRRDRCDRCQRGRASE